ncbi:MAG: polysaccharide deacetylase family protein [Elusimicrobia bacterium]|nr:polysaccharide deacetylase family protein [Elusimicrobiota bacterium]
MLNAVSVDVEEWHDTVLFGKSDELRGRLTALPENTLEILELFDRFSVKATFFILGSAAQKYPDTVKAIARAGHEIASHGMTHASVNSLSLEEFEKTAADSKKLLFDISGYAPVGYRAPTFSIYSRERAHMEILQRAGYSYDSSLYPLRIFSGRKIPRGPHEILPGFREYPLSVARCPLPPVPFLGGTFLRLLPLKFIHANLRRLNSAGLPGMLYFHTWEMDLKAPPVPAWKRAVQFSNLSSVREKIERLFGGFSFSTAREVLDARRTEFSQK